MSVDRILIDASPGETRVALMAGDRLRELWIERAGAASLAGNVYLGRVEKVVEGIAAAFVDIGLERSGFLGLAEARPPLAAGETPEDRISDHVSEGDAVLVQVQREPAADKGAKLTTHISLTGRYAVLLPGSREIRLSRRIDGKDERDRLKAILTRVLGPEEGAILRTAAAGAETAELEADIARLRETWSEIGATAAVRKAPALIRAELDAARRALRDEADEDVCEIVVSGERLLGDLRREFGEMAMPLRSHDGASPLFEEYGVEDEIDRALARRVPLPSGGSLIIDATAALVAIDVNTGGRPGGAQEETALRTDLEAAGEIARQLRLRNLSGQFAVDFVPLKKRENQARLLDTLRTLVAGDRCPTHVLGFTKLGLLEMTRQRRSASLGEVLATACPACDGNGYLRSPATLAFEALRRALRAGRAAPGAGVEIVAVPAVIATLESVAAGALAETRERLGGALSLRADAAMAAERIEIVSQPGSVKRA